MLAISKSGSMNPEPHHLLRCSSVISKGLSWFRMLAFLGLFLSQNLCLTTLLAAPDHKAEFAAHAEKAYLASKARFQSQNNHDAAQCQFGRTCFDWADYAASNHQRADIANEGIAACNLVIAQDGASVPGHYYLA